MDKKLVPAADKMIKILEYMAVSPSSECGVTEIAQALGYNKGTVHPILQTLIANQWVDKDIVNGKYFLSNRLMVLCNNMEKNSRLIADFMLIGNDMERKCGELINLHFPRSMSSATLIAKVTSTAHSLRVDFPIGTIIPTLPSSAGKCLASDYDDQTLRRIYRQCNNNYTSSTLHTEESFLEEIHFVREHGYAVNQGEYEEGIYSVAAPIRNRQKTIIAAINIVIPQVRFSESRKAELIGLVKDGASRFSQLHGWKS